MFTFLLSKIEVGSHLYINFPNNLHMHGETVIVSSLVVLTLILGLILGTQDLHLLTMPNFYHLWQQYFFLY
jgi:hypothetical protein